MPLSLPSAVAERVREQLAQLARTWPTGAGSAGFHADTVAQMREEDAEADRAHAERPSRDAIGSGGLARCGGIGGGAPARVVGGGRATGTVEIDGCGHRCSSGSVQVRFDLGGEVGGVEGGAVEADLERRHVVVGDVDALGLGGLGVEVGEDQLVGEGGRVGHLGGAARGAGTAPAPSGRRSGGGSWWRRRGRTASARRRSRARRGRRRGRRRPVSRPRMSSGGALTYCSWPITSAAADRLAGSSSHADDDEQRAAPRLRTTSGRSSTIRAGGDAAPSPGGGARGPGWRGG